VRVSRLLVPLVAVGVSLPMVLSAAAGARSTAPTFQQYTSPVGVSAYTGIPQPLGAVVEEVAPFGIYTQTGLGDLHPDRPGRLVRGADAGRPPQDR
jgi:hypothetical protein